MSQNFPSFAIGQLFLSGQTGVTAHAGGGQTSATQLYGAMALITTVATAADSVKLPPCKGPRVFLAVNTTATAAQMFAQEASGVTINGIDGAATGVSVPAGAAVWFVVGVSGSAWIAMISAGAGAGSFTTLSASGAVSGAGFTALFASPPAIGGTAPAAVTTNALHVDTGTKTASATTGAATLSKMAGVITSEALSTAAGADYTLTLTNTDIAAADQVMVSVGNGTNSAGTPAVATVTPAAGSVVIVIQNIHASAALNGTLKIAFLVVKN